MLFMASKRRFTVREAPGGVVLEEYTRLVGEPRGRRDRVYVTFAEVQQIVDYMPRERRAALVGYTPEEEK